MLGRASQVSRQPYIGYGGPRIAGFSNDQLAGFDRVRDIARPGGNPTMVRGQRTIQDIMSKNVDPTRANPYEGNNPYLNKMIDSAQGDVVDQFNDVQTPQLLAQFQSGGAFGGSAMQNAMQGQQEVLGEQLGDISTNLRSQNYDRSAALAESRIGRHYDAHWRNQADDLQAAGMVPQYNDARYDDARALMNIGQQQQNLAQGAYDTAYGNFQEWRDWDTNRLGVLANALGTIQGGTSTQTGANPNYRSAGQNAAGYAALLASMWE